MKKAILPDAAGILGVTTFLALSLFYGAESLRDSDTLWHIKFGSLMLERGELITHDTFSHTAFGQPWLAHEWLSEIIMAALHDWAGLPGVALFFFAIVSLTFTLLFKTASRLSGDVPALTAVTVALPFAMTHLLARPHIFTWFGVAATLLLLERGGRSTWLLIPLTALWANLHGGVLFGLTIQLIFIIGKVLDNLQAFSLGKLANCWPQQRIAIFIFLLSIAATCANPFGYQLFIFPYKVTSPVFAQEIGEWRTPDFQTLWYARAWVVAVFLMVVLRGKTLSWRWLLLVIFLLWQALGYFRHLSIAAMLLTPCFAIFFNDLFKRMNMNILRSSSKEIVPVSPWSGPIIVIASLIFMSSCFTWGTPSMQEQLRKRFLLPGNYSEGAIEFIKASHPGNHLLNEYSWGGYLLYTLESPPKIFIDGRADMYGEKIFSDYLKITKVDKEVDELLERYRIDWVLFQKDQLLLRYLADCRGWNRVYSDNVVTILAKQKKPAEAIRSDQ